MNIKSLFNDYPDTQKLLDNYEFSALYAYIPIEARSIITEVCLNILNINPLQDESLYKVPMYYASEANDITSIDIPAHCEFIDCDAFSFCHDLREVKIASGVKKINSRAFYGCINLEKINLPDTLWKINQEAFAGCRKLEEIVLPISIKEIDDGAFMWNQKLTVKYAGTIQQWNKIQLGKHLFRSNQDIHCADGITTWIWEK